MGRCHVLTYFLIFKFQLVTTAAPCGAQNRISLFIHRCKIIAVCALHAQTTFRTLSYLSFQLTVVCHSQELDERKQPNHIIKQNGSPERTRGEMRNFMSEHLTSSKTFLLSYRSILSVPPPMYYLPSLHSIVHYAEKCNIH